MSDFIPQNREQFGKLAQLYKKTGLGAEIGVQYGYFSEKISQFYTGKILCVDLWGDEEIYANAKFKLADPDKFKLFRGDSLTIAEFLPDESLDFVYIDANHHYKEVIEDIMAWYPKVRSGGIIAGHDYCTSDEDIEVIKAVDEWAFFHDYKINVICGPQDYFLGKPYPTWWTIKK